MAETIFDIGHTPELSLRVSVATLSRVIFPRPGDNEPMIALENKATLHSESNHAHISVLAQPFGGVVRILNPERLSNHIGRFTFDSAQSRAEQDFRVFIRPSSWEALRSFCLQNLGADDDYIETDPARELVEEFYDTLVIKIEPNQYKLKSVRLLVENEPALSNNFHSIGDPTVRIYRIDEFFIHDEDLAKKMMLNSEKHTTSTLKQMVLDDSRKGRRGRANAVFVAPLIELHEYYCSIPPKMRGEILQLNEAHMAGNVPAILEDVYVPKYRQFDLIG
jgi:hypothetical protein